jgi:UDP-glucose 4-epimerase
MILVTGGAGYIGTHTLVELFNAGYDFVVFDNFCNSSKEALKRVEQIIGKSLKYVEGDIRDKSALKKLFSSYKIDSVIHFAGLKAVGESVEKPLEYYDNNIKGTLALLETMQEFNCKNIVFSSSATVYKEQKEAVALSENMPLGATNPYGRTKLFIEEILRDLYISDNSWKIVILRYFNPVGAHSSGLIGEDPNGIPNNLMPFISQVAVGKRGCLSIFGDDYNTVDGTGVRDYIHVVDLANGHVKALNILSTIKKAVAINLGTGRGYSVLEVVNAFARASGKKINYKIAPRRAGDIAICFANPSLAKELLDWQVKYNIEDMCKDSWNWQSKNPNGY